MTPPPQPKSSQTPGGGAARRREYTTRQAQAALDDCSLPQLRTFVERGNLPAPRKDDPTKLNSPLAWDADAVDVFASQWKRSKARPVPRHVQEDRKINPRGVYAQQAFSLIRSKEAADWRDLVVRLAIDPNLARDLWAEYHRSPEDIERERREAEDRKTERVRIREHGRTQRMIAAQDHQARLFRDGARKGADLHVHAEGESRARVEEVPK